jgi:PAS domain S-box-containing protein
MFSSSPIPLVLLDPDTGRFLEGNEAAVRIYRCSDREALLRLSPAAVSPERQPDGQLSSEKAVGLLQRVMKEGSIAFEWLNQRPDGELWHSEVQMTRLDLGEGPSLLFFSIQDINRRRHAEEELRKSEARYRELFERNPAPMLIYEKAGLRIVSTNVAFQNHYGYSEAEIGDMLLTDLYPEEEKPKIAELITRLKGHAYVGEWHHRRKDGSYISIVVRSHDLVYEGLACRMGVITDITAMKQAERERQEMQQRLLQSQKLEAIGQLAGGISHDFNNILTAILIQVNLLQEEKGFTGEVKEALSDVEAEVRRAADLTRQLLLFSRRQLVQSKVFDLNSLLGNILKMLRRLIGEHIQLQFNGATESLWVQADPSMMEQVVTNLVVNARDAIHKGGRISLSTGLLVLDETASSRHPDAYPGTFATLAVSDTGCGMDAETLKRIFEPFFTTKEAGRGTGLGLATVFGIMRQHKGWIEVRSAPGEGSCFTAVLPATEPERPDPKLDDRLEKHRRGSETILLVEDEASLRKALPDFLRKLGYRVLVAANGEEALAQWKVEGARIDLLLSDVVMPGGLTGLDLADRLLREQPSLRVILMSGYNSEIFQEGFSRGPGLCFIPKPFTMVAMSSLIRQHLDAAGRRPSTA